MRKDITVAADARASRGKNEARRLRAAGQIPAVLYGSYKESVAIGVNPKEVNAILRLPSGHNTIFNLAIAAGETTPAMIVDTQHDPIRGWLLHTDFKRIDLTKKIRVQVPIQTHGDPKGVKLQGGLMDVVTREVEIECLPDDIPEHFDVDVAEMMIGQSVRAGDLKMAESMRLLTTPDAVLVHVVSLKAEEEAPAAESEAAPAAGAQPEVVKKGKKEEEGDAKDAKKK